MVKYNVDKQKSLFEPIEITLEGKEYKIEKITSGMIKEITESGSNKEDIETLAKQASVLLGADPAEFKDVDVRKLGSVIRFVTTIITDQIEGTEKNVQ